MSVTKSLRERLRQELFMPKYWGIVINPFHITRNALYKNLKALAPLISGDVLDFGCGSKPYETLFASASSYCGVDIQNSGHDHARSKVDHFYDGHSLPFANEAFDAVVSFETLEHLFNPVRIVAEINRVTREGGQLLISVPFVWDEHEVPYDYARYTSFGLRHLLEAAGYRIEELRKTTTYFMTVCQMLIAYLCQHVFPRRGLLRHVCQILLVFPITALSALLDIVLPKRYDFFCDCVVLARKVGPPASAGVLSDVTPASLPPATRRYSASAETPTS